MTDEHATLERFAFGDSPEMADALLALVLTGSKTATCWPAHAYPPTTIGQRQIVLDGQGHPRALIETTAIT